MQVHNLLDSFLAFLLSALIKCRLLECLTVSKRPPHECREGSMWAKAHLAASPCLYPACRHWR